MTYITLNEAAERIRHRVTLAPVPLRTLQRWVQRHPEIAEKRVVPGRHQPHYLEETDLAALLVHYADYELLPFGTTSSPVRSLAIEVHKLEAEVSALRTMLMAELEQRKHEKRSAPPQQSAVADDRLQETIADETHARARVPRRKKYEPSPTQVSGADHRPPPLPSGWISYSAICRDHHVDKRTVDTYIPQLFGMQSRDIAHPGPYRLPNTQVAWALDEGQQGWILAVFQAYEHFKGYRECDNPSCACHHVDLTLAYSAPPIPSERREPAEARDESEDGRSTTVSSSGVPPS